MAPTTGEDTFDQGAADEERAMREHERQAREREREREGRDADAANPLRPATCKQGELTGG